VKTVRGFADIVRISEHKYEIRFYAPGDEGSKNNQGLYEPTGTAHTVWTIENPLADTRKVDKLKVTQTFGGNSYVFDYEYFEGTKAWRLTSGGGLRAELKTSMTDPDEEYRLDTRTVTNGTNTLVKSATKYELGNFRSRPVEDTLDPDGAALKTEYAYYTNSSQAGKYGRLRTLKNPDGSWESYEYDTYGRETLVVRAYKDSAFDSAAGNADATYYSYTAVDQDDTPINRDPRPRTVERKILGASVSKTYYAYKTVSGEEYRDKPSDAPTYPRTTATAPTSELQEHITPPGRRPAQPPACSRASSIPMAEKTAITMNSGHTQAIPIPQAHPSPRAPATRSGRP